MVERLGAPLAEPIFEELAIIGVGLIGSSIARAARRRHAARRIVLADHSVGVLERAKALSLGDVVTDDPARAVRNADCVILCAPVGANEAIGRAIAPALQPGAIVSDVGSVKGAVIAALKSDAARSCAPRAGPSGRGHRAVGPGRRIREPVHQPLVHSHAAGGDGRSRRSRRCGRFGKRFGSHVEIMSAAHHDLVLAITSHVPHLIAYNIVGTAADLEEVTRSEVIKFSAGGFRDFTRIAASDPTMWRDVFLHNKDAVLEMLGRFNEDLTALAADDPARGRRRAVRAFHPDARDPARDRRRGPGDGGAGFRPARRRRATSRLP